jgi:molybdopterin/thiamine biosynthesis adenylyltransferase
VTTTRAVLPVARRVTVAIRDSDWAQLTALLETADESAAVLHARVIADADGSTTTLFVRRIIHVPADGYIVREPTRLALSSAAWAPAFGAAEDDRCVPVFVHTHPGGDPAASPWDLEVDDELAPVAAIRTMQPLYGSLILGGTTDAPRISGRLLRDGNPRPIDRVRVIGERLKVLVAAQGGIELPATFDRQARAFGADGQRLLAALRVGIVGVGGTGSAVAEQLLRLGVGELVVVDTQTLSASNVTRVYGSGLSDEGAPKVELVRGNAHRIGFGTLVQTVMGDVTEEDVALRLAHCDIIFGCTDDHAGRAVLSRMPLHLLLHLIDCGVTVASRDGVLDGVFGRVTTVVPGSPCLVCHGDIDPARVRLEQTSADELARLMRDGYVPELDTQEPSVVVYTTAVAAASISEMLIRLFGITDEYSNRLLLRFHERDTRRFTAPATKHQCANLALAAAGAGPPFLGWFGGE